MSTHELETPELRGGEAAVGVGTDREPPSSGPVAVAGRRIGRYLLMRELARGGMATVHMGRAFGDHGFYRQVAIKRLLPQFARDPQFAAMMLDEARIASSVNHPNVAGVIDVVQQDDELFLVLDYIHGDTLARLIRRNPAGVPVPVRIAASIVTGMLHGLYAAHAAKDERGESLELVHRDISPQNVMVGIDGLTRVLDFGIAKALGKSHNTTRGDIKGKLAYMAPEQLRLEPATQKSDLYAAGIVFWEALCGRRLFEFTSEREAFARPLDFVPAGPSSYVEGLSPEIDAVVLRALATRPAERFASAREMALAIESVIDVARPSEVGAWVDELMARPPARITRPIAAPLAAQAPISEVREAAQSEQSEQPDIEIEADNTSIQRPAVNLQFAKSWQRRSTRATALFLAAIGLTFAAAQGFVQHWLRRLCSVFAGPGSR
jgi:serine/threonine protein kinase